MRSRASVVWEFTVNEINNADQFDWDGDNGTQHHETTVDVVDTKGLTTTFRVIIIEVEREAE